MPIVLFAENFVRNLEDIEAFLGSGEGSGVFSELIDTLVSSIVPTLMKYPAIGRDFMARRPRSVEGAQLHEKLMRRLGSEITLRELISGDYLILYSLEDENITVLSIKHHRQLAYEYY